MPKSYSQTTRNVFNKGLLTEFSELSFPNEASIDELNCTLHKAGNRTVRAGIQYEPDHEFSAKSFDEGTLFGTGTWYNVGNEAAVEFLVVQGGPKLYFYVKDPDTFSANPVKEDYTSSVNYVVNLNDKKSPTGSPELSHVEVTSVDGKLVVVSPQINAFYIERDTTTGAFTETFITFKIRDFEYLNTRESLVVPDATPGDWRKYDTQNCGWVTTNGAAALATYQASQGEYPALTHPWYSGKDASGNFSVAEWQKIYSGNSLIVNGHYILDLHDRDRITASGLSALPSPKIPSRFQAVAAFAGRVFFAGIDSRVYFSPILESFEQIGNLYQLNDPTSEEISDLLDTDGGWVEITEAVNIKKVHAFGNSILVFADNGVWRISGVDGVFRATEFSVFKITDIGLATRKSFAAGRNAAPFWWSFQGIHTLQVTDEGGIVEVNISRDTIQTFWEEITGDARAAAQAVYDATNDVILWMYPTTTETISGKLNKILLLDIDIGAFYPWEVSDEAADTPYIVSAGFFNSSGTSDATYNVVDEDGNNVQNAAGDDVVVDLTGKLISSSAVKFVTVASDTGKISFSEFTSLTFLDWETTNYTAFAESAYNFMGDLGRRKTSPYITIFMRMTETGWEASGNGYTPVRNSSLKVSGYWDFRNTVSSTAQEAYRFKYPLVVDTGDLGTWTYPQDVMTTRLKLRGRGRVMRLRFENTPGKDFNLLGWETLDERNTNY